MTYTLTETLSETIVKAANQSTTVTDSRGRSITFKPFNALDRMKFFEAMGAENSKNQEYVQLAAMACVVRSIDGDTIPRPSNKAQLEALVQRLDDDGLEAVMLELQKQAVEAGTDDAEATLKNA